MVKNIPAKAEEVGSVPGSRRAPGERKMATHSSILVWEIPWTEEPGGLQYMVSQKKHDLATKQQLIIDSSLV